MADVGAKHPELQFLYRLVWEYRDAWLVPTDAQGLEASTFSYVEGETLGPLPGRFRGTNHGARRTDGTFLPDAQGVILPTDGSSPLIVNFQGFGSTYPSAEQRRVVTSVTHRTANVAFLDLNDSICIGIGENTESPESVTLLTMDVFQAVWTQLDTNHRARPSLPNTITIEPWFRK